MSGMTGKERGAAKKKSVGKKGGGGRADDDDSVSVMSEDEAAATYQSEVAGKNAEGEDLSPEERADQLVEQLAEKRASTRQAALSKFIDQLQQTYNPEFVANRLETLQMYLLNSVRKGDAPEVVLACRALTLVSITLGAASETLVQAATPILREHLKNSSKSNAGRAAVAEALGFLHFIGAINDKDTIEAMAMLTDALKSTGTLSEAIATACWEAWGLLATSLPTSRLAGATMSEFLPTLIRFLDDESIDVKTAAGENIALLMEAKQTIDAEKGADSDDDPSKPMADDAAAEEHKEATAAATVSDESKMSDALGAESPPSGKRNRKLAKSAATAVSANAAAAAEREALIAKLSALATESSRYKAKKDRAIQRKSFRDILRTVEDGDVPDESLKIEKSRHSFSGWAHIKQLQSIREVLGKGLNVHFVHNELIADIFDLYIEAGDGVDDPGRKAASRAQSKQKALDNFHARDKQRKKKSAMTNPHAED